MFETRNKTAILGSGQFSLLNSELLVFFKYLCATK